MKQNKLLTHSFILAALTLTACGDDGGDGAATTGGTGGVPATGGTPSTTGGTPAAGGSTGGTPAAIAGCTEDDPAMALNIIATNCSLPACHADTFMPIMASNVAQNLLAHTITVFCSDLAGDPLIPTANPASSYFIAKITSATPCAGGGIMMPPPPGSFVPNGVPSPPSPLQQAQMQCLTNWIIDLGTPP